VREQVLHYIRERKLLKAGDRVAVAVSGGADSVALLRVLMELRDELGLVLFVAHFNHGLRGESSDADERFVAELTKLMGLEILLGSGDVREHAKRESLSLEAAARDLRYKWLTLIAAMHKQDCVATAHTLDDQAETVLMKFLRGAGTRGLAGIYPEMFRGEKKKIRFIRPLLATSRAEIEAYLKSRNQPWCEDHTNVDTQHTRNRMRHELLPLLERDYNPSIRRLLGEAAEVARGEEEFWQPIVVRECIERHTQPGVLRLTGFERHPAAFQRRLLKQFLDCEGLAVDFHLVENLRQCALGEIPSTSLSGDWVARREDDCLQLVPAAALESISNPGYEYCLPIPGSCTLPQAGLTILATVVPAAAAALEVPGTLLSLTRIERQLTLRNWLPGDRFRPAHSVSEEKLKRLFSERKVPAEQRHFWPVALNTNRIVWVRGFSVAHDFAWIPSCGDGVLIEVVPSKLPQGPSSPETTSK